MNVSIPKRNMMKTVEDVRDRQCGVSLTTEQFDHDIHLPRLQRVAEHLEEVWRRDPGSFNLSTWVGVRPREVGVDLVSALEEWPRRWAAGEELNCGTSACMVGHLPLIFPDAFEWIAVRREVRARFPMPVTPTFHRILTSLQQYFGLHQSFWYDAIYDANYYWCEDGKPGSPSAAEMASLIRAAIEVAEAETKP